MVTVVNEVPEWRTESTKHWDTDVPGVFVMEARTGPMHFRHPDKQGWQDLADLVVPTAGGWVARTVDHRTGFEDQYVTFERGGMTLAMRVAGLWMVDASRPLTRAYKVADASYASTSAADGVITVTDVFPGIDLRLEFDVTGMNKTFTVHSRPTLPDPVGMGWNPTSTYLAFVWDMQPSSGVAVMDRRLGRRFGPGHRASRDLYVDGYGAMLVRFVQGVAEAADGRTWPLEYVSLGSSVPFAEALSYATVSLAQFPMRVDPTSTYETTANANDAEANTNSGSWAVFTTNSSACPIGYDALDQGKGVWVYPEKRLLFRVDLTGLSGKNCDSADLSLDGCRYLGAPNFDVRVLNADYNPLSTSAVGAAGSTAGSFAYTAFSQIYPSSTARDYMSLSTPSAVGGRFGSWCDVEVRQNNGPGNQAAMLVLVNCREQGAAYAPGLRITYSDPSYGEATSKVNYGLATRMT